MKKKEALYLIFIILLSFSVCALYEEKIFEGNVASGQPFMVDGDEYEAIFNRFSNQTIIFFPEGYNSVVDLSNQTCASEWIYKTCVDNVKYLYKGREMPPDIHEVNINITFDLEIYASYANIVFNTTTEKTILYEGESSEMTILIANDGELIAENISFVDAYPDDFKVISAVGCDMTGTSVSWNGELAPRKQKKCTYIVKGLKEKEYTRNISVKYFFLDKSITSTKSEDIKVAKSAIEAEFVISSSTLAPEEILNATYNLLSNEDLDNVYMNVLFPETMKVESYSSQLGPFGKGSLRWQGDLETAEEKKLNFSLSSKHVGNFSIAVEVLYTVSGIFKNYTLFLPVNVEMERFYVWTLQKENETIVRLVNPTFNTFQNIVLKVFAGEDEYKTYRVQDLGIKRFTEFILPYSEDYLYEIRYRTSYGQYLDMVSGSKESVNIHDISDVSEQAVEPEEIDSGEIVYDEKVQGFWDKFDMSLQFSGMTFYIIGFVVFAMVALLFYKFVLSGSGKTGLDKEIEDLKKQEAKPEAKKR
ncbi:MAG: hypothetical protein KKF44_02245 [Nanoarchaeota archaeon]|nr:hypothetical protein [Nanoarchaeota archaeon]